MTGARSWRIAIVEDEAVVARRLERLVRRILGDRIQQLTVLGSLGEALAHVRSHSLDLLFLDLDLHGQDGFGVLTEVVAESFHTIIVSARHDQALRAFEYGVVDFVPKPYGEPRLRQALDRLSNREDGLRRQLRYLAVRKANGVVPVPVEEVVYVSGAGDYSELHCEDGAVHLHGKTLTELLRLLPPDFVQVHRSHLVDLRRIRRLHSHPGSRYSVALHDGAELPVSRRRIAELRRLLA